MPKKILIFAPAGAWMVHHQVDCLIGAALQQRGCTVNVLGCDRLLHECEVQGGKPEPATCAACEQSATQWFSKFQLPVTWLSHFVPAADVAEIEQWAGSQDYSRFGEISWQGLPLGQWMMHTLHATLKTGTLDYASAPLRNAGRLQLRNAAITALATQRALDAFTPDFVLCYSGANSFYRVFYEICRRRGIHGLCHERGYQQNCFMMARDLSMYDLYAHNPPEWEKHRQSPLSEREYRAMEAILDARSLGKNTNFQRYHQFVEEGASVWHRLRLQPGRKTVVALTSGDWEYGMVVSHGQLHHVWKNQEDWLEDTMAICAKESWNLVIRIHPLSAGTATYPRADQFLSRILARLPEWGEHVRVVFPSENLSTYDLMTISDAIVTVFSTAGAEAMVRGMPVLCIAECRYQGMGMRRLASRENYPAELAAMIATEPCADIEALRGAFRHAAFLFLRVAGLRFARIGIKDIYYHDIDVPGEGDLLPGHDPVLDRVCDCILQEGSLYVDPDPEGTLETETRLLNERLTALKATRAAGFAFKDAPSGGVVSLLKLLDAADYTPALPPHGWRSRHQETRFSNLLLDAAGGPPAMRAAFSRVAETHADPFIYFLAKGTLLDESALSQAVDLLNQPQHSDKTGVLMGCYVLEGTAEKPTLGAEWNTATHPADAASLPPKHVNPLSEPAVALGLVVWRREALTAWAAENLADTVDDSAWCGRMLASFLDSARFVNLREPVVHLQEQEPVAGILRRAEELAAKDLDAALALAATCQARTGFTRELRSTIASWLVQHGRHAQAAALLFAEYRSGKAGMKSWPLLQESLLQTSAKRPGYKAFAPAVETVFGYMVPGQERFLHEKALSLPHEARILEIGVYYGRSTTAMAYACVGTRRRITCFDTFCGNEGLMGQASWFYNKWRGNLRRWGLEAYATARRGFSHPLLRDLAPDEMFDFVFIDASHEYADVLLDFELVWPHVKPGGWIGFHDVEPGWPGCWRVWEQTGRRLLTDHAICATLACGRKAADVPWKTFEEEWPGFMASVAGHLSTTEEERQLGEAMQALMRGDAHADTEQVIAHAPEALRQQFINAIPEAGDDPWLHRMLSLMLAATDPDAAARHRDEALKLGQNALAPL